MKAFATRLGAVKDSWGRQVHRAPVLDLVIPDKGGGVQSS
jgi:hypothetical protein